MQHRVIQQAGLDAVHVSNILAKLGAVSRTEAAAIAHQVGLAANDS